jgi:hypothetical protein
VKVSMIVMDTETTGSSAEQTPHMVWHNNAEPDCLHCTSETSSSADPP